MKLDINHKMNEITLDEVSDIYSDFNSHPELPLKKQMNVIKNLAKRQNHNLTNEQLFFACCSGYPILSDAGPGSGKTTSALYSLISQSIFFKIPMHQMLVCVYTQQAKEDFSERARSLIDNINRLNITGISLDYYPTVSTVHSLARSWIEEYCYELGYTSALMKDALIIDVNSIIDDIIQDMDEKEYHLLSHYEKNQIVTFYNYLTEAGVQFNDVDPIEIKNNRFYPSKRVEWPFLKEIYKRYGDYKLVNIKMDFTDFLMKFYGLLKNDADILRRVSSNYKYIVVDEFQDSSPLFIEIFKLLATSDNIKCMGDSDQTLFNWRGIESYNMLDFKKHFPNGKITTLTLNMRCPAKIVELSNRVITKNKLRYEKDLYGLDKDHVYEVEKYIERESMILRIVQFLDTLNPKQLRDTVITFRNKRSSSYITTYLTLKTNYQFDVLSGMDVFSDILSKSLIPLLNIPFSNNKKFLLSLYKYTPLNKEDCIEIHDQYDSLEEYIANCNRADVAKSLQILEQYIRDARDFKPASCLMPMYNQIRLHYLNFINRLILESGETLDDDLFSLIIEFFMDDKETIPSIRGKIVDLLTKEKSKNCLKLSTIHGLKGMEFTNVVLIDVNHSFPNVSYNSKFLDEQQIIEYLEEETRVLYVALTRTKHTLKVYVSNSIFNDTLILDDIETKEFENFDLNLGISKDEFRPAILPIVDVYGEEISIPKEPSVLDNLLSGYRRRGD